MRRSSSLFLALSLALALLLSAVPGTLSARPAPAAEPLDRPLKVVLVGDSFSAGNGARDASGSPDYFGPIDCHRSHGNWAGQYVDWLTAQGYHVSYVNRACSGGVTAHLVEARQMDTKARTTTLPAEVDTLDQATAHLTGTDPCNSGYYADEEYFEYRATAFDEFVPNGVYYTCTRFLRPQTTAINGDTDLVLFTMGGNDIQFDNIVQECFAVGFRDPGSCRDRVNDARTLLAGAMDGVVAAVNQMRANGLRDDARVVYLGYPLLALDNGYSLTSWFGLGNDTYAVADEVRALGRDGNAAQLALLDRLNEGHPGQVTFVDEVPATFEGHEPDGRTTARNPDRWLWEFEASFGDRFEWYHPNPAGHAAYRDLLISGGTFGADGGDAGLTGDIDIVFAIDTTGSMGGYIGQVQTYASDLVDLVSSQTSSGRYALVTYRDHPEWTGWAGDYPSRLDQPFTSDPAVLQAALDGITVNGGGDWPESMYSGLREAIAVPWRPGVKKVVIVLADAPPHDPEPVSGLTADDIIAQAIAVDPAEVYVVDPGWAVDSSLRSVVDGTGGVVVDTSSTADVPGALREILDVALTKPFAWINGPYVARAGTPVTLDGSGSYATTGTIASYAWDFTSDGVVDTVSTSPQVTHTWDEEFSGLLTLTVTDTEGRTSVANTHVGMTDDGDEVVRSEDNCPDVANMGQADFDEDGVGDACDPEPGYPTEDKEGVVESLGAPAWDFTGFLPPVRPSPELTEVRAGSSVPLKFSVDGDRGLDILVDGSPSSTPVDCGSLEATGPATQTASVPGLRYDTGSDLYSYVWTTPTGTSGCVRVDVALVDGSVHDAYFRLQ
jgi:lysophospholipase L1-like esterase/PKD repeat protein